MLYLNYFVAMFLLNFMLVNMFYFAIEHLNHRVSWYYLKYISR